MKNSFSKILLTLVAAIFIAALPSFAAPSEEVKATAVKFLMAMGGVVVSTFVIFWGLTIYNKLFVERKNVKFTKEDSLSTPNTINDAVTFFIKKNKLR